AAGVPATPRHVLDRYAAEGIIDTAKECGSDLIVMTSHGRRGMSRVLLGSQTVEVLTHGTVPVLVIR
ncbi:universal stress protein, partial [Xanthomonas sp. Kuri4-3]